MCLGGGLGEEEKRVKEKHGFVNLLFKFFKLFVGKKILRFWSTVLRISKLFFFCLFLEAWVEFAFWLAVQKQTVILLHK